MPFIETLDDTDRRRQYYHDLSDLFASHPKEINEKLADFPLYVPNNSIARFLVRYELMKMILNTTGVIIECGVGSGSGVMSFVQLSTILEPYHLHRQVVGFDSFEGFPSISEIDKKGTSQHLKIGGYRYDSEKSLLQCASIHEKFRPLRRAPLLELVRGDIRQTVPQYVRNHPELVVALCYLDCDLYEPTKTALEAFLPRMPKGSIVVFDELGLSEFPGETHALHEVSGLHKMRLKRFPFTKMTYAILE